MHEHDCVPSESEGTPLLSSPGKVAVVCVCVAGIGIGHSGMKVGGALRDTGSRPSALSSGERSCIVCRELKTIR